MSDVLVIDIETAPDQEWLEREDATQLWLDRLEPPGNMKKAETIKGWIAQQIAERRAKAALSPWDGRIRAIGFGLLSEDELPQVLADEDEAELLNGFAAEVCGLVGCRVGGWAVRHFDLPFIAVRCAMHDIVLPGWWPSARDYRRVVDGRDYITQGHLDQWLMRFGLPPKTGKGADAPDMPLDELIEHRRHDVVVERLVLRRLAQAIPDICAIA